MPLSEVFCYPNKEEKVALEIVDSQVTEEQFEEEYNKAIEAVAMSQNPWRAMTYIEGVRDTLAWLGGDRDEAPLAEL